MAISCSKSYGTWVIVLYIYIYMTWVIYSVHYVTATFVVFFYELSIFRNLSKIVRKMTPNMICFIIQISFTGPGPLENGTKMKNNNPGLLWDHPNIYAKKLMGNICKYNCFIKISNIIQVFYIYNYWCIFM